MFTQRRCAIIVGTFICIAGPLVATLGTVLRSDQSCGFRDAAFYYRPLWRYERLLWREGLPLWNDHEELGRPFWADPTACVLYPGKILLYLPGEFGQHYDQFLAVHVVLAATLTFLAARRMRLGCVASLLAGVCYAFCGQVLFQVNNPPYLIGASWLPLGVIGVLDLVERSRYWYLACALCLMTLGGDPQTAYLLAVATGFAIVISIRQMQKQGLALWRPCALRLFRSWLTAVLLGLGLSAPQWIPTAHWASASDRTARHDAGDTTPLAVRHETLRYEFSVGPWRWIEMFWPNIAGPAYPTNARWLAVFAAEGRYWTPSLYAGVLPMLLSLRSCRWRHGRFADRWLTWIGAAGMLGSLGVFGIGWLFAGLAPTVGTTFSPQVGGLYWVCQHLLPGFALFRYPAKLWTWTSIAIALLAGRQLDDLEHQSHQSGKRFFGAVQLYCLATVGLSCIAWLGQPLLLDWWRDVPSDALFGPFMAELALTTLRSGLAQATIVIAAYVLVVQRWRSAAGMWALVAVTACDLAWAHRHLIPTVATSVIDAPLQWAPQMTDRSMGPIRVYRELDAGWYPEAWLNTTSDSRMAAAVEWQRQTFRSKYPLPEGYAMLRCTTSFTTVDHHRLLTFLEQTAHQRPSDYVRLLETLGIQYVVAKPEKDLPNARALQRRGAGERGPSTAVCWQLTNSWPRVWVASTPISLAVPQDAADPHRERLAEVFFEGRELRDLRTQVVLDEVDANDSDGAITSPPTRPQASCRIVQSRPNCVDVDVRLSQPGYVVLNDRYDADWTAKVTDTSSTTNVAHILRANGVMRAVKLPRGTYRVRFEYRPLSVQLGLIIGGATWAGVIATAGRCLTTGYLRNRR